ncbi:alpha/beta fold hydrolase [Alkalihalobacillus sp. AL-G]|uniref:alpha/beta fold hydrolase n=1 Tax=Alkalihalobacillus sp. AL-G TaxID=2926399 RepID=UPI00272AB3E5|nr:alpha/beta hydrolase [Alkalihalobacillus sp. AL-G]WLD94632.1 alpha/beta hydrolase [Alkalihalobacillus sp. AL-G]
MSTNLEVIDKKVDVGGFKLNYSYHVINKESPTVILESGHGMSSEVWNEVKNGISSFANIFLYDRAGLGKSELGNKPHHSNQVVENLNTLLQKENIKPPYILVGHSLGGIHIRVFAHTYPEKVIGLVLVDSAHEEQDQKMVPYFSKEIQDIYYSQFVAEGTYEDFKDSLRQVRDTRNSFVDIPIHILSAGVKDDYHNDKTYGLWLRFQKDFLSLSNHSKQVIAKKSNHFIHNKEPELVIESIKKIINKNR